MPDEIVVRCRLAAGLPLERPLLRLLRAELRRSEALAAAGRTLARRDLSRQRLAERLRERGVAPAAGDEALATLARIGLLDDERLVHTRAIALAERGYGDAAIAARLEAEGFDAERAHAALAELAPEAERAAALVEQLGDRRKGWTVLARRGFAPESAEAALGPLDEEP